MPRAQSSFANERRRRRSSNQSDALTYQLVACCAAGQIDAMVISDGDGLPLASAGDTTLCDEVAARIVVRSDVQMNTIVIDGAELSVCAVGGSAEARRQQVARGAEGAMRILRAA